MAGRPLKLKVELLDCDSGAASLARADFAIGCFWGVELAFQRVNGVVATKVGYTQGSKLSPTYNEVCSGSTGHTEAVQVMYDPKEVTYETLLDVFWQRLGPSAYKLNQVGNDQGTQYRHGIYYSDPEQMALAIASKVAMPMASKVMTEILPATKFWDGEDYHQQYLQKGGQSARKDASQSIRCYG
mmetsp:Transcript_62498/g.85885  ORF Transcript_62498/g.85885 Transcript_62498/m.85885 type:complete len:185 (-) Transcript_62498:189-743(-)|eukprot:CAMPEP_0185798230 /NCGR_PEP_ID=MMETSP1174-20130828/162038_1 /TAXON_ID=35687 /ORGANISM="Dictyocha speculum, Strain CCMP1381" /LENGTH=184 /DNA_ID=CAMNT_0028493713 /DNA_START=858 /DNA_END=1412 /DNA_ORIENTATION=-